MSRAHPRIHSRALLVVVIGALMLSACGTILDAGDAPPDEPDLVSAARATLTYRETQREPTPTYTPRPAPATFTPTTVEVASTCEVDQPIAGLPPGLPPGGPSTHLWYGSEDAGLWASPMDYGVFLADELDLPSSLWFAGEVTPVLWFGVSQPLEVTGEQLDGDAMLEPVTGRNALLENQWTDVLIPEPGCWRLTGATASGSLTLTVEALPVNRRADFQLSQMLSDARPYPPPPTCPATPFVGPDARGEGEFAHYWLEADGISADVFGWFVAGEQQGMGIYGEGVIDELTATLRRVDQGVGSETTVSTVILNSEGRLARFVLPEPGCWELEFETAASSATFTLYVYPAACSPELIEGAYRVSCEEP